MTLRYRRSQPFARANPVSKLAIATLFIAALVVGITSQNAFAQVADGQFLEFHFIASPGAGEIDGVNHRMGMWGFGRFNATEVEGGGAYNRLDVNTEVPKTRLESGHWQAVRVVEWSLTEHANNPYGPVVSGILDLEILLFPLNALSDGIPARLRIVCNIGNAGVFTDFPEGIFVETPDGLTYEPVLVPTDPAVEGLPPMLPVGFTTFMLPMKP